MPVIDANHIAKNYRALQVLTDCSFSLDKGEIALLSGANGCGKSTFLSILFRFELPDSGTLILPEFGKGLTGWINTPVLFPELSGIQNIRRFFRLSGTPFDEQELSALLTDFSLTADTKHAVTYSTGTVKKWCIIRSLLTHAPVIIFDEPFSGLDSQSCAALCRLLTARSQSGSTILLTNHESEVTSGLTAKQYILFSGQITEVTKRYI